MRSGFIGAEWFGGRLAILADQYFNASLGFFQLFTAGIAQSHAAFEQLERTFEREVASFQLFDDLLEFIETGFEGFDRLGGRLVFRHRFIILPRTSRPQAKPQAVSSSGFSDCSEHVLP